MASARGKSIFVLSTSAPVDVSTATATIALDQPVLDADWTGDGSYLVLLKAASASGPGRLYLVEPTSGATPVAITTSGDYERVRASPAVH